MLELSAYTPTGPVQVFRYPNSPVHVTEASMLVNNNPTITKFPDPTMVDPYADRTVMWSQDGAVYVLHGYGPFTDDELVVRARAISAARG